MPKDKSLFDQLYEGAEDVLKAIKKPQARRGLKRKMRAGYDSAQSEIDKREEQIQDEIAKMTNVDMQKCVDLKAEISGYQAAQNDLAAMYMEYFDEEFDPSVE